MMRSVIESRRISPLLRYTVLLAAFLVYMLIFFGGILRATGAGLACPDWPLCYGHILPPADMLAWLDWWHRLIASAVGLALITATAVAWAQLTITHPITRYLALTVPIVLVQAGLGGLAVIYQLPPGVIALHLALSLFVFMLTLMATVHAFRPKEARLPRHPLSHRLSPAFLLLYVVIILGGVLTDTGAGTFCQGWPLCGQNLFPSSPLGWLDWIHRGSVLLLFLVMMSIQVRVERDDSFPSGARWWLRLANLLLLINIVAGALQMSGVYPKVMAASHLGLAAGTWTGLIIAMGLAYRTQPAVEKKEHVAAKEAKEPPLWRIYLSLTKPGIVALLLVTTIAGMVIAARGWPGWRLVGWTMLASFLSAGGANTLNSHYDRDIDGLMSRTARRPLPQGKVAERNAFLFGVINIVLGVTIMALFVNLLSALIMLIGAIWYAGIYTRWLKRSTVQNIVIGGAAGALAPVVGWAAVTNRVDVLAWVLFALIFLWTPPHTWAFSILVLKDYKRVGVPMLPVVKGLEVTTRQIILYSWLMILATLIPIPLRLVGPTYTIGVLILNGIFLYIAYRLRIHPEKSVANKLYQYSNAYLYLVFALMVFDRMGGLL